MTLSALIKKGGLSSGMTATVATPATQEADKPVTVATVATVAVAEKPEPLPEVTSDEESNIRAWLAHIGEADPELPARVRQRFILACNRSRLDPEPVLRLFDAWRYPERDLLEMDGWPDDTVAAHCRTLLEEAEAGLKP